MSRPLGAFVDLLSIHLVVLYFFFFWLLFGFFVFVFFFVFLVPGSPKAALLGDGVFFPSGFLFWSSVHLFFLLRPWVYVFGLRFALFFSAASSPIDS